MIFLEFLIAGNTMIGPNLCKLEYIHNNQLYSIEYKCDENGNQIPDR